MEEISATTKTVKAEAKIAGISPGVVVGGRFEIMEKIGEGGMATVFKARQESLGRYVAIKVLHKHLQSDIATLRRFDKEARSIAALNHHNLVGVIDNGVLDGCAYLVMDFIEGTRLADLLGNQKLSWSQFKDLANQLCAGLAHAHNHGLVHRDLKPGNIMLTEENGLQCVKIVDFGIAKSVKEDPTDPLTSTGEIFGTSYYMSPEQCQGQSIDHRSDIYSLGCVFFQMLSGELPFVGTTPIATVVKHLHDPVPKIKRSDIPAHVQGVIERAMAKDADDRFQSVQELAAALNSAEVAGAAREKSAGKKKRHTAVISAVLTICVLGASALALQGQFGSSGTVPGRIVDQAKQLRQSGDLPGALALSQKAAALDPDSVEAHLQSGLTLSAMADYPKAFIALNRALAITRSDPRLYIARGDVYLAMDDNKKALADYGRALGLIDDYAQWSSENPEWQGLLASRGHARQACGDHEGALQDLTRSLMDHPDDPGVLTNRAISRAALHEYDMALTDLDTALRVNPDFFAAYATRASVYIDMGKLKEAYADASQSVNLEPASYVAYNNRGYVSYLQGDFKGACKDIDRSLQLNPKFAEGYVSRGDVLFDSGDVKGAAAAYRQALGLSPANEGAIRGLAYVAKHPSGGKMPADHRIVSEKVWQ